jgi:uncharacterized protein YndB with AHSA1/START domain
MEPIENRTLSIQRTFKAPVQKVWKAWTEPKEISKWWAPSGTDISILEHNFRVGGQWNYVMFMPNGNEFVSDGIYSNIIENEKIISSANFKPMTFGVQIQILFKIQGNSTLFRFNCVHESEEYSKQQEEMGFYRGWGAAFDRLAVHLQG